MPNISAFFLAFLLCFPAFSVEESVEGSGLETQTDPITKSSEPSSVWAASEVREIVFKGMAGKLELVNVESDKVSVQFEDWFANTENKIDVGLDAGVLTVSAFSTRKPEGATVISPLRVKLKVSGPSKKVTAHFGDGEIVVNNWAADAKLRTVKGLIQVTKSRGHFEIFSRRGSVSITDHEGVLGVETVYGTVAVKSSKGDLSVSNFSGSSSVDAFEGEIRLVSHNGSYRMNKNKGELNYNLSQSELSLADHEGKITGQGKDSVVRLGYVGKASIRVKSEAGNVFIKSPKSSGARVNVGSVEGFLGVPGYIKATQWPSIKVASGRLDGFRPGSIHVRTQSGAVYLR